MQYIMYLPIRAEISPTEKERRKNACRFSQISVSWDDNRDDGEGSNVASSLQMEDIHSPSKRTRDSTSEEVIAPDTEASPKKKLATEIIDLT